MDEATNIIHAFIQILKERNPAFSPTAWQALSELDRALENLTSDKNFDAANTILDWCDKYPEIMPALREVDNPQRYIGDNKEQQPKIDPGHQAKMLSNVFIVRETIKKAIQQPSPNSTQQ